MQTCHVNSAGSTGTLWLSHTQTTQQQKKTLRNTVQGCVFLLTKPVLPQRCVNVPLQKQV